MKASNSVMPKSETSAASSTRLAGLSSLPRLKANSIRQSETGLRALLGPVLIGEIAAEILARGQLITQAAAVGARGETPDLVHLGEVFRAQRKPQHCAQG